MSDMTLSIIIPYYNERDGIAATLHSLAAQNDRHFRLLLVDNASTDGSAEVVRATMAAYPDIDVQHLHQPEPGQQPALRMGLDHVETGLVASCDADTIYPPDYVRRCRAMFAARRDVVGVMAIDLYAPRASFAGRSRRLGVRLISLLFRSQCHAGGYAHAYRTAALRAAGGFESPRWPYVLYDHELAHRMMAQGRIVYHSGHICHPSARRGDRGAVGWNFYERMVYLFSPPRAKDWFFYEFLGPRFAARGLSHVRIRERDF
jgi:glycosyltransferase involved in cell wall biosynthesis